MILREMDRHVSIRDQLQSAYSAPVTVINEFTVEPEEADDLVAAWADDAAFFKAQPGFISTQLHRGIGGSCVFVNYAVWESLDAFRQAFMQPEFQSRLSRYPESAVGSPHLFEKLAVPGICVA